MNPSAAARSSGFSLIEVLLAMFILSIGAASVLSFFAAAASTHKRSVDRTHAALIAEAPTAFSEKNKTETFSVADARAAVDCAYRLATAPAAALPARPALLTRRRRRRRRQLRPELVVHAHEGREQHEAAPAHGRVSRKSRGLQRDPKNVRGRHA